MQVKVQECRILSRVRASLVLGFRFKNGLYLGSGMRRKGVDSLLLLLLLMIFLPFQAMGFLNTEESAQTLLAAWLGFTVQGTGSAGI